MIALAMGAGWLLICAVAAIGPRRCIVWLVLAPLIRRNLRLRAAGRLPDEWYWADRIACRWGFYVSGRCIIEEEWA